MQFLTKLEAPPVLSRKYFIPKIIAPLRDVINERPISVLSFGIESKFKLNFSQTMNEYVAIKSAPSISYLNKVRAQFEI